MLQSPPQDSKFYITRSVQEDESANFLYAVEWQICKWHIQNHWMDILRHSPHNYQYLHNYDNIAEAQFSAKCLTEPCPINQTIQALNLHYEDVVQIKPGQGSKITLLVIP